MTTPGKRRITAILHEVQAFVERYNDQPCWISSLITGDPGNNFDGYYVEFEPRDGDFNEGSWLETVSPGVEYKIDPVTMPHLLVRKSDGNFWFGSANGQDVVGIGEIQSRGQRTAGTTRRLPTRASSAKQSMTSSSTRTGLGSWLTRT